MEETALRIELSPDVDELWGFDPENVRTREWESKQGRAGLTGGRHAHSLARSRALIVTLIPGDQAEWRPSVVHHPIDEPVLTLPGSTDELLDNTHAVSAVDKERLAA